MKFLALFRHLELDTSHEPHRIDRGHEERAGQRHKGQHPQLADGSRCPEQKARDYQLREVLNHHVDGDRPRPWDVSLDSGSKNFAVGRIEQEKKESRAIEIVVDDAIAEQSGIAECSDGQRGFDDLLDADDHEEYRNKGLTEQRR